MGIDGLINK